MGNIKDEIKRNRIPRRKTTYENRKCPKCEHEELQVKITNRINYTHGKYSQNLTPIKEKGICHYTKEIKKGKETIKIPCGYGYRKELRK